MLRMARQWRWRDIELQHALLGDDPLVAPLARVAQRPGAHPARFDQFRDVFGVHGPRALPCPQGTVAVGQCEQRRYEHRQHGVDCLGRIAPGGAIACAELDEQGDRLHLRQRAARQHAAVVADQFAEGSHQAGLAEQPAGLAIGQEQPGGNDGAPRRRLGKSVFAAMRVAVEPSRLLGDRMECATAQALVYPRQDQRRMNEPVQQSPPGVADGPCRGLLGP